MMRILWRADLNNAARSRNECRRRISKSTSGNCELKWMKCARVLYKSWMAARGPPNFTQDVRRRYGNDARLPGVPWFRRNDIKTILMNPLKPKIQLSSIILVISKLNCELYKFLLCMRCTCSNSMTCGMTSSVGCSILLFTRHTH